MLGIIIDAFKSIIDLLHRRDENRNVRADTALKERELADKASLLVRATDEDVRRYDPKVRRLGEHIARGLVSIFVVVGVAAILLSDALASTIDNQPRWRGIVVTILSLLVLVFGAVELTRLVHPRDRDDPPTGK